MAKIKDIPIFFVNVPKKKVWFIFIKFNVFYIFKYQTALNIFILRMYINRIKEEKA